MTGGITVSVSCVHPERPVTDDMRQMLEAHADCLKASGIGVDPPVST
jgi:hypothetical protein